MIVNYQKPIEFINDCGCLVDLKELEKAIVWYSYKPVARLRKIYMHGNYPAVSIYHEKIHVHRLLMMYWERRKLKREEYVHHKDENKLNALKENLVIMPESEHQRLHTKGREFSRLHRLRIGEANRKRKGEYQIDIPLDELRLLLNKGWSIRRIARHFNCSASTIDKRIKRYIDIYEDKHLLEVQT